MADCSRMKAAQAQAAAEQAAEKEVAREDRGIQNAVRAREEYDILTTARITTVNYHETKAFVRGVEHQSLYDQQIPSRSAAGRSPPLTFQPQAPPGSRAAEGARSAVVPLSRKRRASFRHSS